MEEIRNDKEKRKAAQGHNETKDDPLRLLALPQSGDAQVAIDLQSDQAQDQHSKHQGTHPSKLTKVCIAEKDVPHFIEDIDKYAPSGPAGHKSTRGEEQEEGRDAHLSQQFQPSDQPIPGGSHGPQTDVQQTSI